MFRQISAAIGLLAYAKRILEVLHTKKMPVMQIFYVKMHDFYFLLSCQGFADKRFRACLYMRFRITNCIVVRNLCLFAEFKQSLNVLIQTYEKEVKCYINYNLNLLPISSELHFLHLSSFSAQLVPLGILCHRPSPHPRIGDLYK